MARLPNDKRLSQDEILDMLNKAAVRADVTLSDIVFPETGGVAFTMTCEHGTMELEQAGVFLKEDKESLQKRFNLSMTSWWDEI